MHRSNGYCFFSRGTIPLAYTVRNYSNSSKVGIGIYIKASYSYKLRKDLSLFIPNIFESIFVEAPVAKKQIITENVYRPNTYPKAESDIFIHTMHELQKFR